MTDKIKEAHEWHKDGTLLYTLKQAGWEKGIEQFQNETTIKVEGDNAEAVAETILKALSAYEKLQGVDGMKKDTTYHQELLAKCDDLTVGYNDGYNQAIDDVKARLVADIGGK